MKPTPLHVPDAAPVPAASPASRRALLWTLAIFFAAVLAFEPALFNTFTFDDVYQVQAQPVPHSATDLLHAAAAPWWPPERQKNVWRPLTRLSILTQRALSGGAPWPFYAFNIALHCAVCVLLFLLARRLGFSHAAAGLGALLFAVHPIHAEAVHQVVGRAELGVAFWMLAGLLLFLRWGARDARSWLVQPLLFALALGTKEHAMVYPCLLALAQMRNAECGMRNKSNAEFEIRNSEWDILQFRIPHSAFRILILWVLLFIVVLALFFWGKAAVTGGLLESPASVPYYENPLAWMAPWPRLGAALGVFGYAASRLAWPLGLAPDYSAFSLPYELGWAWPWCWAGAALLAGILVWAVRDLRRGRSGWALAAAALGSYVLVGNVLFPIGVVTAQRLWYWPSAPCCLGLGWLLAGAAQRLGPERRRLGALLLAALLAGLVALSWGQARAWRSPESFALATVQRFPRSWRGNVDSARACYRARDFEGGLDHAHAATAAFPSLADGWAWVGSNAMFMEGRQDEAEAAFRRALELDPRLYEVHRHWAHLLASRGRYAEADRHLEAYLADPAAQDKDKVRQELSAMQRGARSAEGGEKEP